MAFHKFLQESQLSSSELLKLFLCACISFPEV